ncbi:C-8 sterol isomerase [Tricholoma furcatifolium]|nr:C-8 sterol isomerase [Tricholoma furcatifolium]
MAASKKTKTGQGASCTSSSSCLKRWLTRLVFSVIFIVTCGWLDSIKSRWYVFDPASLHTLAQSAIAASPPNDTTAIITHILTNLTSTYPSTQIRLNTVPQLTDPSPANGEWVFNNAGGAMGAMYIIHASITEYLIIFGTPLGTEGHTGLHTADDYFHILVGEQWAFKPGALEMERYGPGSVHFLPRFTAKQYKMHEGCFALEYARGWIPLMLPFGLLDTITSTLDIPTFYNTARITAREMIGNLLIGKI